MHIFLPSSYECLIEFRRNIQQITDTIKDRTTNNIPIARFVPLIYPVIIIVITTKHTSIGNSNIKFPQSFLSLFLAIKYLSSEINNNKETDSQNAYDNESGFLKDSKKLLKAASNFGLLIIGSFIILQLYIRCYALSMSIRVIS